MLGLIIWKFLGIHIKLDSALLIDALLQFSAGYLDLRGNKINRAPEQTLSNQSENNSQTIPRKTYEPIWCWRLASAVVFLTVGIQVTIFNLAHHVSEYFGSYILATFYFGVSIAALFCKKLNIQLDWDSANRFSKIYAANKKIKLNSSFIILFSGLAAGIAILGINYWPSNNNSITFDSIMSIFLIYFFVFI